MTNRYYQIVLLLLMSLSISCERDDICAESTSTTPNLIIRFFDREDPDEEDSKNVRQLEVRGFFSEDSIGDPIDLIEGVVRRDIDSISIPLRFDAEGVTASSTFQFVRNADLDEDNDDESSSDIEILTFTYTPSFEYVSRACGYKSVFELQAGNEIRIETSDPDERWFSRVVVLNPNIDNETDIHVAIFH